MWMTAYTCGWGSHNAAHLIEWCGTNFDLSWGGAIVAATLFTRVAMVTAKLPPARASAATAAAAPPRLSPPLPPVSTTLRTGATGTAH